MSSASSRPSSQQRPIYISSNGSLAQKPSLLRQIEDFFLSLWEILVLFFKTLLEPSTDVSRVGKRASSGKGGGYYGGGGGGGGPGGGGRKFKDMSSSNGPTVSSCQSGSCR